MPLRRRGRWPRAAACGPLSDELECGSLSINHFGASLTEALFGSVRNTGYGREGGSDGLSCYTVTKNISHLVAPPG